MRGGGAAAELLLLPRFEVSRLVTGAAVLCFNQGQFFEFRRRWMCAPMRAPRTIACAVVPLPTRNESEVSCKAARNTSRSVWVVGAGSVRAISRWAAAGWTREAERGRRAVLQSESARLRLRPPA